MVIAFVFAFTHGILYRPVAVTRTIMCTRWPNCATLLSQNCTSLNRRRNETNLLELLFASTCSSSYQPSVELAPCIEHPRGLPRLFLSLKAECLHFISRAAAELAYFVALNISKGSLVGQRLCGTVTFDISQSLGASDQPTFECRLPRRNTVFSIRTTYTSLTAQSRPIQHPRIERTSTSRSGVGRIHFHEDRTPPTVRPIVPEVPVRLRRDDNPVLRNERSA